MIFREKRLLVSKPDEVTRIDGITMIIIIMVTHLVILNYVNKMLIDYINNN